jgi:hypothetical protein
MLIGTPALELAINVKVSTLNAHFTSFYYKELLQKMQVSVFEKYIPLHGLKRNNVDKRHGPI